MKQLNISTRQAHVLLAHSCKVAKATSERISKDHYRLFVRNLEFEIRYLNGQAHIWNVYAVPETTEYNENLTFTLHALDGN